MSPVLKLIGADFELSNALVGAGRADGRVEEAARRLLAEIPGYPHRYSLGGSEIELGRRFLDGAGGSAYIDSGHLEINCPEHASSTQHALHIHAGLRIARRAQVAAAARLPHGTRLNVLANCSDRHRSWGSHLNMLVSEQAFHDILYRKPHLAGFFATHLVTSTIYAGQGQVGPGNGRTHCDFQLSQRADWFETFSSEQTMHSRPLLNLRAEHHAQDGLARLHIIYFDMLLAPTANFLKAGTTALVLAMVEAGWADPTLQLDDPLAAASQVSRDLSLRERLPTAVRGRAMSAVEIQAALAELAGEFVASGAADSVVPDAAQIVDAWRLTVELLRQRDLDALARRSDAWLKYLLLDRQRQRRGLLWRSADMQALDLLFASIDPDEGLFFRMAGDGVVEGMPTEQEIERCVHEPPEDTRAYLRAHVLRRFGEHVSNMDWSWMDFRLPHSRHWWSVARLPIPDPRCFGRAQSDPILNRCESLNELVEAVHTEESQHLQERINSYATA